MKSPGKQFKFRRYGGDRGGPALEVDLLGINGKVIKCPALLDTGAEWTTMPHELGVELGAPLDRCKPVTNQAAGGEVAGLWWNDSPEGSIREEPAVSVLGVEASIAPMLITGIEIVALGREDFFASFRFDIDQRAATFSLTPYEDSLEVWLERIGGPDNAPSNR